MSDTRFFPGWTWVYMSDPMYGLCYEGTPEHAARHYFQGGGYWSGSRPKCYTLTSPDAEPVLWTNSNNDEN